MPSGSGAVFAIRNSHKDKVGLASFVVLPASVEERDKNGASSNPDAAEIQKDVEKAWGGSQNPKALGLISEFKEFKYTQKDVEKWSVPLVGFPVRRTELEWKVVS